MRFICLYMKNKLVLLLAYIFTPFALANDIGYINSQQNKFRYFSPNEQAQMEMNEFNKTLNKIANENISQPSKENNSKNYQKPLVMDVSNITSPLVSNSKYKNLVNVSSQARGCWDGAAKAYGLDPWLLMAIAKVESSFNNVAINKNKNNSTDLGMMQINTIWLPTLQKFGIKPEDLMNPCTSIFVGAWIMAQNIKNFGYNLDGIGAYNSPGNVKIRRDYARKVYKAYNELTNDLYFSNQLRVK